MTILTALLLATMVPEPTAVDPIPATAESQVASPALQLSRIVHSETNVIGDADDDRRAVEMMQELFDSDPDMADMERDYPGIVQQFAEAMLPIINESSRERLPDLQARHAALYAETFTDAELAVLIAFYSSATGRKLISHALDSMNFEATMAEMKQSGDFQYSAESTVKDSHAAAAKAIGAMNAEDQAVLAELGRSGLLPKLQAMALQTHQITIDWNDEYASGEEVALDEVLEAILDKRMESSDEQD
ncbi:DUF2059 domain-containing protein [Parasphingorhabdus sp.]|uniref:DUF2059 domain-containing protein n=1 Tax=Parasphingorhabdus sp. TaxID=2709688 RepID=UPI0035942167